MTAVDIETLARELGIDAAEVAERQAFLEFTDQDTALLVELHDLIERTNDQDFFVDAFYTHLQAFADTRVLLGDEATLNRLKQTQRQYFHSLTAGAYGLPYAHHRLRVGAAHQRVGLAPKWYLGAYNKYLSLLIPKIDALIPGDPEKARRTALALLKIVLFDMGLAIDTYMHAEERAIRHKSAQLVALNQIALALTSSLNLDEILNRIMCEGIALSGCKAACIAFCDPADWTFRDWTTQGLSEHFVRNIAFRPGGLADETFITNNYVLSNDRPGTKHLLSKLARDEGILGFICLPLTSGADRLGVIYFYRSDRDSFDPEEIELLTIFARLAAQAIENARLHAQVDREARIDVLTGLLNRRVFDRRLDEEQRRAQRYGKPYALMMIDIDRFKRINDSYGHPAGDAVLKTVGRVLMEQFRDVDIVARYGGEEFTVILPEISGGTAKAVAERVRQAIAGTPFTLPDGREIGVTVSIGVSCYPNCALDAATAVGTADQALYIAKQAGRNRVLLYRETLKARLEKDPNLIVEMLNENPDNFLPIATAISTKTAYLRRHGEMVVEVAQRLATALNLHSEERDMLQRAAVLHDIGMVVIPDAVLAKAGPLTPEEWEIVKRHPATGADLLEGVPALRRLA
ncbi:MAG: diguanylate cyclase, partial [Gammaproteobacteria bacterium]|nr:diguanylate cyclase [Gammaproteobacteria bacterium]